MKEERGKSHSGGGILSGLTSLRNSLLRACSAAQRLLGSRFNMWSKRSRADGGMLGGGTGRSQCDARRPFAPKKAHSQGELLPQAPPVLFLWFHGVEEGQLYHVWPDGGTGAPTDPAEGQKRVGLRRK